MQIYDCIGRIHSIIRGAYLVLIYMVSCKKEHWAFSEMEIHFVLNQDHDAAQKQELI